MKILILNYKDPLHPEAGGAERYAWEVANLWSAGGHQVSYFTSRHEGATSFEYVGKIKVIRAGSKFSVFRRARQFLKRSGYEYDMVIDFVNQRSFAAHRRVGNRAIAVVHHLGREVWQAEFGMLAGFVGRYLLDPVFVRELRGVRVIAVSKSTGCDLESSGVSVEGIIPPGVDLPLLGIVPMVSSNRGRIVFVGRLVNNKRPRLAIEAFELLRQSRPELLMDMVGDGYLRGELEKMQVRGLQIHGRLGELEKQEVLSNASVVVVTSLREGWGIVALEAASYGIPVVACDIMGLRDSVVDGVTGLLVDATPEAIANAVDRLLTDGKTYLDMSLNSIEWAGRFTWEQTARSLLHFGLGSHVDRSGPLLDGIIEPCRLGDV